jgi:hypothetical protein
MLECNPFESFFPYLDGWLLRSLGWEVSIHGSCVNVFARFVLIGSKEEVLYHPCIDGTRKGYVIV